MSARAASDRWRAAEIRLTSEFASVTVTADVIANGPRLRIENRQSGRSIYLDPLELASLTWLTHSQLGEFLDPSRNGWEPAATARTAPDSPGRAR